MNEPYDFERAKHRSGVSLGLRLGKIEQELWDAFASWDEHGHSGRESRHLRTSAERFIREVQKVYADIWVDRVHGMPALAEWATGVAKLYRETWCVPVTYTGGPMVNLATNTWYLFSQVEDHTGVEACAPFLQVLDWLGTEEAVACVGVPPEILRRTG